MAAKESSYYQLVLQSIKAMREWRGSSVAAISKWV